MENEKKEIAFVPDFRDAFMGLTQFLSEANLPVELIYKNKRPNNLPEEISRKWDIVQAFYEQEKEKTKNTGDIVLL